MTAPFGDKPAAEKNPVNWYWVGAFVAMAQLGVLLESAISPESIRFLGNPLTSVGIWGAVLCVLFKKEKAKTGHPQQAGIVSAINATFTVAFLLLVGHIAVSLYFGSAITTLVLGGVVFLVTLLFRLDYKPPVSTPAITPVANPVVGFPWLRKQCRICDTVLIDSLDFGFINDAEQRPITHCHHCGTNCEGPITQPLTPTAQEFIDGDKADLGFGSLLVDSSQIPPDPLPFPYYEYSSLIGPSILVIFAITFRSATSMAGPYLSLQWLLGFAGIAWYIFASRSIFQNVKSPCPHCQANLFTLAFRSGTLRRVIRYRKKDGHYVLVAAPRYCPYCGNDIETPPLIPPSEVPCESSDTPRNI